ncbi:hypothetical protein CWI84_02165 [Idiomarina tyrosinivorans]|uniref:Uncharacterized protein n=1 Tax=Idiomarina tyrosinivorans TaxID=1445662 RepID=A0A432ZTB3_9GAMM|nr:hypothetical protein CWI84_02165 [Idiomarina tyrosinivorans]
MALEYALDIRKFEIELYWKRATYFWALIAVAFTGFFAVLASENIELKNFFAFVIGVIGFVFTWAWFLANKGSKFWQENWENHVDMLESATIGPLYKTILHRPNHELRLDELITRPAKISVSKLNQWVSFFTLLIWLTLLYVISSPFDFDESLSGSKVFIAFVGIISCSMMCCRGKTHLGAHRHKMRTRKSKIL